MREKTKNQETQSVTTQVQPVAALERFFKKQGVYDGKMFHSGDKVTYTFVADQEVVSLHFDNAKKAIYYKGRNISNMELNLVEKNHLEQFLMALRRDAKLDVLANNFNTTFSPFR